MKFFVDTANVEDIKKANDMGVICGVTTNPSLIAKEGRDFNEVIKEITSIVDGPISGEVKATTVDAEGMIKEGREIAAIHPNMVVKIPMTVEGLKAVKVLSSEGIKTNVTLIFSANQAILAADAVAYTMAATSTRNLQEGDDPDRGLRLFWCVVITLIPLSISVYRCFAGNDENHRRAHSPSLPRHFTGESRRIYSLAETGLRRHSGSSS